jgi:hypothetical protein
MNTTSNRLIMRNRVFAWIALATCALLLIPFVVMRFTTDVNWGIEDFVVMGSLLFASGTIFVLLARNVSPQYRLVTGFFVALTFLYVWAELAVGIFTSLGS